MDNLNQQPAIDQQLEKDLKKYQGTKYDSLIKQIDVEYQLGWYDQFEKNQAFLQRLKLYNNQKRNPNLAGDPLMFTVHQTVLASLYDDELAVTFRGREQGDDETAENLNDLARFDHEKMGKEIHDYMLDWDALFFGRGLSLFMEFDRSKQFMCPIPENLDPATFIHDPKASSVNGDIKGRGGMRFGGHEMFVRRDTMTTQRGFFDTQYLRSDSEMRSLLKQAEEQRGQAQNVGNTMNRESDNASLGDNGVIPVLRWFTYWKGKRVMALLANNRRRLVKYYELPFQDRYPIIDRPMYAHTKDWYGTSIPDLTEDKQRQRSVMLNLGIQASKADLYPMYLYDEDRIKNKGDLLNFEFNKFVGINNNDGKDVASAVRPLNKPSIRMDMVQFILNTLDTSAQKATATPDMQQGQLGNQNRTLGELNLVASKVDTRYSLTARVFGWSEKEFWRWWYRGYKEHFHDFDEKVVRVTGSLGNRFRPMVKSDIITDVDPDVFIESKIMSDQERTKDRVLMQGFGNALILEPTANRRFFLKELAKLNGFSKDKIMILIPPTSEELKAEDENKILNDNKLVQVTPQDDHMSHLEIHSRAAETTAKAAHIAAHKKALEIKRMQPNLFPTDPSAATNSSVMADPNNSQSSQVVQTPSVPGGASASASAAAVKSSNPFSTA